VGDNCYILAFVKLCSVSDSSPILHSEKQKIRRIQDQLLIWHKPPDSISGTLLSTGYLAHRNLPGLVPEDSCD